MTKLNRREKYIPTDKHVLVSGATGTGKSFLCENYLKMYKYVVKLDTKDEYTERKRAGVSAWVDLEENKDFTVCRTLDDLYYCETDKIIFAPDYYNQTDETFEEFFTWIFERENTILWVDELMSVGNSYKFPKALGRLYQQGRSKNIGIWACTQRPTGIPSIAPANSNYFFTFNLYLVEDRKKLAQATGRPELLEIPNGYNFWYYKMGDSHAQKAVLKV